MKHLKHLFFCLILMLFLVNVSALGFFNTPSENLNFKRASEINVGNLNPMWEYYNSLPKNEKGKWEAIPEKYIIPSDNTDIFDYYAKKKSYAPLTYKSNLPLKYDLREHNAVSKVENQGNLGICWAFAANASLESNLLLNNQGSYTFSERQIDYASAKNVYNEGYNPYGIRDLTSGGTFYNAAKIYAMGFSPVEMMGIWSSWNENTSNVNFKDVFNLDNNKILVTDYVMFPDIDMAKASLETKENLRNKIKSHVIENGVVYISTLSPQKASASSCYIPLTDSDLPGVINWNESCEEPFATKPRQGSHAMAIVGWDDSFNLSYCAYPDGNTQKNTDSSSCTSGGGKYYSITGAWILKNSWGDISPYVYLAYDSKYIEAAGITKVVDKDYDNSYNQYGPVYVANSNNNVAYLFYKPVEEEKLVRVTFNTSTTENTTYKVYYGDRSSGIYTYIGEVSADTPGRYSVEAHGESLYQEDFVIYITSSESSSLSRAVNVYAFTNNTTALPSATSTLDYNSLTQDNNLYKYYVETRASNLPVDTKLFYVLKDSYGSAVWIEPLDNAYLLGGAYEGYLTLNNKLKDNTIYYLETYANNTLIGTNSFATGINLKTNDDSYYILTKEDDLKYLTTLEYKFSKYVLASDISLNNPNFTPIGLNLVDKFRGTLEGDNHIIYNLRGTGEYTGLFYQIEATINNLKIKNVNLNAGNSSGVLASIAYNSHVNNVLTEGILSSQNSNAYLGGVIGKAYNTEFNNIVNETSLAGGKSGAITGYLGENSLIKNALNQGLISGNKSAISTFFHSSALKGNVLDSLVDLTIENEASCGTPYSDLSSDNLKYSNIVYPSEDNCTYLGKRTAKEDFKKSNTYNGFSSSWVINDNNLPYLKDNPVIYITDIKNGMTKNLFSGTTSLIEIKTEPDNATYKGVKIQSNNEGIVKVIDGNKLKGVSPGKATVSITTLDGTYLTKETTVYVLNNNLKEIYQDGYLIVFENVSLDYLQMGEYTVTSSTEKIGTGTKLTYQIGSDVVGEFTTIIKGDLNKDGQIQANDILLMKRHILELDKYNPLDNEQLYAGNISGDGITSLGILKMQRHILNLDGGGKLE